MSKKRDRSDEDEYGSTILPSVPDKPQPTVIGGLPAEDYLTEQEKHAATGAPLHPTDEDEGGEAA